MLERKVSAYLNRRVKELGGEVRRVKWIGRNNAPDKLVMLPGISFFVEEKRTGAAARAAQLREHERMRRAGLPVFTIDSPGEVDAMLDRMKHEADLKSFKVFHDKVKPVRSGSICDVAPLARG